MRGVKKLESAVGICSMESHPGVHLLQNQTGRSVYLSWSPQEGIGSDSPRCLSAAGRWNVSACAVGYGVFFFLSGAYPPTQVIMRLDAA